MSQFDIAEYIKNFSKEELTALILNEPSFLFKTKRQIDSIVWRHRTMEIEQRMSEYLNSTSKEVNLAKEMDALSREFNSTEDLGRKLTLVDKIKQKRKKLLEVHKEYEKLRKEQEEIDLFYEQNLSQPCD